MSAIDWIEPISFGVLVVWLAVMCLIAVRGLPASPRRKRLEIAMRVWALVVSSLILLRYLFLD